MVLELEFKAICKNLHHPWALCFLSKSDSFYINFIFVTKPWSRIHSFEIDHCFLQEEVVESPEIHFEPVIRLPEVEVKSLEEDEEETFKMYV